jgi:hypothetical protein
MQNIINYKMGRCRVRLLLFSTAAILSFSCSRKPVVNPVSHAVIEYELEVNKEYKYIPVAIKDPQDITIIEHVMTVKENVRAMFPRKQYLTVVYTNGEKVEYDVNGFVLRDTNHCYIIPEGELRSAFINLIHAKEPSKSN